MTFLALLRILSLSLPVCCIGEPGTKAKTTIVDLGYEIHQGTLHERGEYYNFSNIRYAAPPTGARRFAPPAPPEVGQRPVFNDGSKAVTCIQALPYWTRYTADWVEHGLAAFNGSTGYYPPDIADMPPQNPEMTEDCLFLDIQVPKRAFESSGQGPGLPVMVWIHGGGYTLGSKTLYSPSAEGLLRASQRHEGTGILWLAMNYRLGSYGFLSGPTFAGQGGTSNAGLLDQRFALEWVQKYIHLFGGDPNRVTVIGESAGGGSVMHQITAYGGSGGRVPFHRAIVQSPGYLPTPSKEKQELVYAKFLQSANVTSLQQARSLPAKKLQFANYKVIGESDPYGTFTFNPTVDGAFIPDLPSRLLLRGRFDASLEIMAGHNILEGLAFMNPFAQNDTTLAATLRAYFPTISNASVQHILTVLYPAIFDGSQPYSNPTSRAELMITEAFFTCNTNWLAKAYHNTTYNYIFGIPPSLHGDDIPYTYSTGPAVGVKDQALAETMQGYFTSFASTGTPNSEGLPYFPRYGREMVSQNLNFTISQARDAAANSRCDWWELGLIG